MAGHTRPARPGKMRERLLPAAAAHGCLACEVRRWSLRALAGGSDRGIQAGSQQSPSQAMLSPFKRSISLLDLALSDTERHRATERISFASRGSEVHRGRSATTTGRGHKHASGPRRTVSDYTRWSVQHGRQAVAAMTAEPALDRDDGDHDCPQHVVPEGLLDRSHPRSAGRFRLGLAGRPGGAPARPG
jgi:hypothetical protein